MVKVFGGLFVYFDFFVGYLSIYQDSSYINTLNFVLIKILKVLSRSASNHVQKRILLKNEFR